MAGHLRRRSKGSWTVIVELPRDPVTGKRRQKQVTVRGTKQEAMEELHKLAAEVAEGKYGDGERMPLGQYLLRWLDDFIRPPRKSIRTYESYQSIVHAWNRALGQAKLGKLRPMHLQRQYRKWLDAGLSSTTVQHYHAVIHKALKDAVRMGLIARNVADSVEAPKIQRKAMTLPTNEELARLLAAAEGRWIAPIIRFALQTGMREGEIAGLKWQDVDLAAGRLHVQRTLVATSKGELIEKEMPKTKSSRRQLVLGKEAVALLRQQQRRQAEARLALGPAYEDGGFVWAWPTGKPINPKTISSHFARVVRLAGIPHITFHDLRHISASLLLAAGVHPRVVQERLGHSTFTITMDLYSHVAPTLQEEAATTLDKIISGLEGGQMEGKRQKRAAREGNP